jgi:hypothetical protein
VKAGARECITERVHTKWNMWKVKKDKTQQNREKEEKALNCSGTAKTEDS